MHYQNSALASGNTFAEGTAVTTRPEDHATFKGFISIAAPAQEVDCINLHVVGRGAGTLILGFVQ
jgi:hypothetical protein